MSRARGGHIPKSEEERRRYWENTIRVPAGPTLEDTAPVVDTTDQPAPTEEEKPPLYPTKQPSVFSKFLREKGFEVFIVSILLVVLGWYGYQLYKINREVGELRANLINVQSEIEKLEQRSKGRIEDVSSDVDRLERRIDRFIDGSSQKKD